MTESAQNAQSGVETPSETNPTNPGTARPWLTVAEVVAALSTFPGDRIVYVDGDGDDFVVNGTIGNVDGLPCIAYNILTAFTGCPGCEKDIVTVSVTSDDDVTVHADGTPACPTPSPSPSPPTVDEFILAANHAAVSNGWRIGQAYFNTLRDLRPDLVLPEAVRGYAGLDPFHDDSLVPRFLEWVTAKWDAPADEVTV